MERLANSQKRFVYEKSEKVRQVSINHTHSLQEEKRLFILLCAIIIIFFLCTIPAAPLTMLVADNKSNNLTFQVGFHEVSRRFFSDIPCCDKSIGMY